jgi:hypothetical protein
MSTKAQIESMIQEMALTRVSRMASKPGDKIAAKTIWISHELAIDGGLELPSWFKTDDQIYIDQTFKNIDGRLVPSEFKITFVGAGAVSF